MGRLIVGGQTIECDTGAVSDGYHTFDELYEHRHLLFIALMRAHPSISWRSKRHADGSRFKGWFIAGMNLGPRQIITYHLPERMWKMLTFMDVDTLDRAPEWDGHTSKDVIERLTKFLSAGTGPPLGGRGGVRRGSFTV